jgi:hypothetical protein
MLQKLSIMIVMLIGVVGIFLSFADAVPESSMIKGEQHESAEDLLGDYRVFEGTPLPREMKSKTKILLGRYYNEQDLAREKMRKIRAEFEKPLYSSMINPNYLRAHKTKLENLAKGENEYYQELLAIRRDYSNQFAKLHEENKDYAAKAIAELLQDEYKADLHYSAQELYTALIDYLQFLETHHGTYKAKGGTLIFEEQNRFREHILFTDRIQWAEENYEAALNTK